MTASPDIQEMFSRAWAGMASQGWRKSWRKGTSFYFMDSEDGDLRCTWGHVDPEGTRDVPHIALDFEGREYPRSETVSSLRRRGVGVAARLEEQALQFAIELQGAHDRVATDARQITSSTKYTSIETSLRDLATKWGLAIPGENA